MKYLNRRTGAVIDVPCPIDGSDWEEVTEAKTEPEAAPVKVKKTAAKRKAKASD